MSVYDLMGYRDTIMAVAEHSMKSAVEDVTGAEVSITLWWIVYTYTVHCIYWHRSLCTQWVITYARHDSTVNAFHTTVSCLSDRYASYLLIHAGYIAYVLPSPSFSLSLVYILEPVFVVPTRLLKSPLCLGRSIPLPRPENWSVPGGCYCKCKTEVCTYTYSYVCACNGSVMIDLSKAFDTIDHSIVLDKLCAYGARGTELMWFADYLSGRSQQVMLNGVTSEWSKVVKGVPQGSILGPLLFIIFVNDLPDVVEHSTVNLYADDTAIYTSGKDPGEVGLLLEQDLHRVANWITSNRLMMNVAKTQLMVVSSRSKQQLAESVRVRIGEEELSRQDSVKYLGGEIDRGLCWKQHIEMVRQKCFARLASIRRAGRYLPWQTRRMLYQSLVLPHLDYCAVAWHTSGAVLSDRIERVQNYAMRMIFRQPPRTNSESLRQALGWSSLKRRRHYAMLYQVHRSVHNCAPSYLVSKFTKNSALGYLVTRGADNIHLKRPHSNFIENLLSFRELFIIISYLHLCNHLLVSLYSSQLLVKWT